MKLRNFILLGTAFLIGRKIFSTENLQNSNEKINIANSSLNGLAGKKGYVWNKNSSGRQIIAMLKKNGWKHDRTSGSHYIMTKNGFSCPVPYHSYIPIGTFNSIKKIVKNAEQN